MPEVSGGEVTVEGRISELWSPSSGAIAQVGLIEDESGQTKFTSWEKSNQPVVKEGETVRFRAAAKNWYQGRCSIALTGGPGSSSRSAAGGGSGSQSRRLSFCCVLDQP